MTQKKTGKGQPKKALKQKTHMTNVLAVMLLIFVVIALLAAVISLIAG